jgi:proteic killer suppression protein
VIRSFRDKETGKVFRREFSRKFQALAGDRLGHYSIRVNDQWRICFRWVQPDAIDVEIVDYH